MATIRQLSRYFDPAYVRPDRIARVVRVAECKTGPDPTRERPVRRGADRRCGVERRQRQAGILFDMRSPHARRKQDGRRAHDLPEPGITTHGIDVYA